MRKERKDPMCLSSLKVVLPVAALLWNGLLHCYFMSLAFWAYFNIAF